MSGSKEFTVEEAIQFHNQQINELSDQIIRLKIQNEILLGFVGCLALVEREPEILERIWRKAGAHIARTIFDEYADAMKHPELKKVVEEEVRAILANKTLISEIVSIHTPDAGD
ncbi:hypothetical protein CKQ16_10305 [Salmonella enterica subsp. enterica serovar Newport]|nr:hypothetical protein [Salmonella enterica subsp. enterica serovar Newport]